jgi:two-component system, chemotaxis family, CheB/CheR fusion protein
MESSAAAPPSSTSVAMGDALPPDDAAAASSQLPFCTVAIGASAGGVEALARLFSVMPADTGCAFVVALHLAPDRVSMLTPLIQRSTRMPVLEAKGGQAIEPDHVYVVPPGQFIEVRHGTIASSPIAARPPHPITIDCLMKSLAADQRERAIGVVLTGSDGDGALGVKALKAEGGLTLAQLPSSAAHPGMPQNAIATGLVDQQLTIEDMPAVIAEYGASLGARPPGEAADAIPATMGQIIDRVRALTGLDFRDFKPPMLVRRVRRRMALARTRDMDGYLHLIAESPAELAALCDDFLISVTEFFREPDAWNVLAAEVIPSIIEHKAAGEPVRAWVPACSTGEEAYGIAMLLLEQSRISERHLPVQVFATDVNGRALEVARKGIYPRSIEHAVSRERLQRFFHKRDDSYLVRKELREAVMFAPQNLVSDPPFSRMDLVSCRNLLIYMEPALQQRVLQIFHFALEGGGYLFLGKSETIGSQVTLFAPASKGARIYRRMGARGSALPRTPAGPIWRDRMTPAAPSPRRRELDYARLIREALLDHRVAAAVLIDSDGHTLYFYGPVQAYLDWPEGEPSVDVFAMVRDDLRPQLRAAVHKASSEHTRTETVAMLREGGRDEGRVRIIVSVVPGLATRDECFLVTFERMQPQPGGTPPVTAEDSSALKALESELRNTKRELRSTIEELESTNEELKVANEEAMSMNEELQSTNEELETSKEELQSVNEELTTVNTQLQEKVGELEELNDVLSNLLSSTHIPTLFLDRKLRIRRFTPAATELFSLIAGDVNRPLTDISSEVDLTSLVADAGDVLVSLAPIEREERTRSGSHYLRRTLPYRTVDDRIDGIVITFTDITELRRGEQDTRRLAAVMRACNDAIIVLGMDGRIDSWNGGAQAVYGYSEEEAVGKDIGMLIAGGERAAYLQRLGSLKAGEAVEIEGRRRRKDGREIEVSSGLSLITHPSGGPPAIACLDRDITPRKLADKRLRDSEQRFRTMADSAPVLIWVSDSAGRIEFANREFAVFCGFEPGELAGRRWPELLQQDTGAAPVRISADAAGGRGGRLELTAQLRAADGELRWMKVTALPRPRDASGAEAGMVGSMVDVHSQVEAERALRLANVRKDEFLAMLGHELRNPLVPIRNAAEVLKHLGMQDPRLDWAYDTLVQQVGHVTRLVDDLLDISRVTRGALVLHLEPVDLCRAIDGAIEATRELVRRKGHRLDVRIASRPCYVEGDSIRLVQIFENLLANAAKYTDDGGEISLVLQEKSGDVVVTVRDNGLGIVPGMKDRIFDLFVQDARSLDRSQGGLGIGLALVRHLVEMHGGKVEARSEGTGRGSEFEVRLPRLARQPAPQPRPAKRPEGQHARILLVDDDLEAGESLAIVLRLMGYDAQFASDLPGALAAARALHPDIAVLDVAMPGTSGYEVAERLRTLPEMAEATAYLTLSGFGQAEDFKRSEQAGMARHLVKPVDPEELDAVLQVLMQSSKERKEKKP